jgi:hypothetical protein
MKYCSKKEDIPKTAHLAVLRFYTVHIPGDERSRTHPGHGYGPEDKAVVEYISFDSPAELKTWVEGHKEQDYVVIDVNPKKVTTRVVVDIG